MVNSYGFLKPSVTPKMIYIIFYFRLSRHFNQSTKFGAMLDMLTDRCATMCLLATLGTFYPNWLFFFQLSMTIDISCHWIYLHTTTLQVQFNIPKKGTKFDEIFLLLWRLLFKFQINWVIPSKFCCLLKNPEQSSRLDIFKGGLISDIFSPSKKKWQILNFSLHVKVEDNVLAHFFDFPPSRKPKKCAKTLCSTFTWSELGKSKKCASLKGIFCPTFQI